MKKLMFSIAVLFFAASLGCAQTAGFTYAPIGAPGTNPDTSDRNGNQFAFWTPIVGANTYLTTAGLIWWDL
jgi:hypothetical protein